METRSDYTYETLPEFLEEVEGAKVVNTTGDEPGVFIFKDVEYCEIDGNKLHLQILVPNSRNNNVFKWLMGDPTATEENKPLYPCVVYVQGSAWMKQELYSALGDQAKLAARGYVVAIVEYRHSGIAAFPAPVVDARNAVRFMKKNASQYFVDTNRMIIMGNSSGGHTAMYAGIYHNDDNADENLFPGISAETKGVVNHYGSTEFMIPDSNPITENHNMPDSPEGMEMGFVNLNLPENEALLKKITVRCNIDKDTEIAPTLILHGTKDRLVNTKCSVMLYEHMKECGKDVELYLVKGADHGGPEFWMDEILDIEEEFFNRCFNQ